MCPVVYGRGLAGRLSEKNNPPSQGSIGHLKMDDMRAQTTDFST